MQKILIKILRILLLTYLGIGAWLYFSQRNILYHPTAPVSHQYQKLQLQNSDGRLNVIALNPGKPQAVIYFGGNAESVARSAADYLDIFPEHSIYLMEYRGFGDSSGSPSESGLYADAVQLYDKIKDAHQQISLVGRSLGSGIATYLAAQRPVSKLVLVTPYDSIENVAQSRYPFYPIGLMLKDKFNTLQYVARINIPTLVLLSEKDNIVPHPHSQALIQALPEQLVSIQTLSNTQHNNINDNPIYYPLIRDFLQHSKPPAADTPHIPLQPSGSQNITSEQDASTISTI